MKKLLETSSQLQSKINQLESMASNLSSTGSSKEDLENYNNISDIKKGDKLIIPKNVQ